MTACPVCEHVTVDNSQTMDDLLTCRFSGLVRRDGLCALIADASPGDQMGRKVILCADRDEAERVREKLIEATEADGGSAFDFGIWPLESV